MRRALSGIALAFVLAITPIPGLARADQVQREIAKLELVFELSTGDEILVVWDKVYGPFCISGADLARVRFLPLAAGYTPTYRGTDNGAEITIDLTEFGHLRMITLQELPCS